jgi:hypothetical protein
MRTTYIPFALREFHWDWTINFLGQRCIKAETPGGLISVAWGSLGSGYSVEWGDGSFEDFSTAEDIRDRFIEIGIPGHDGV